MTDGFDPERASAFLRAAVTDTLADMTFLDALPLDPGEEKLSEPSAARAMIDVLKPASCRLEIRAPESFRAKVSDILFSSEEGAEAQDDAFLEILNVATGKFLTEYFGPGTEIKLELPRFLFQNEGSEGRIISALDLDVEGSILTIVLSSVRYRY